MGDKTQAMAGVPAESRLRGSLLMCAAVLMFTGIDTTAKYLLAFLPIFIVVWSRFVGQLLVQICIDLASGRLYFWRTRRPFLQIFRSLLLLLATLLNFTAIAHLPLPVSLTILYTFPLIVAGFAPLVLNERLPAARWLYLLVAFGGVLVVMRPWTDHFHWAMLAALGTAMVFAAYSITTRMVARSDTLATNAFYSCICGALFPWWLFAGDWQLPTGALPLTLFFAIGVVFATIGHQLIISAHSHAPAPILAPYSYTALFWVSLSSTVFFNEPPDTWTIVGCSIIVLSSLSYFRTEWKEHRGRIKLADEGV